MRENGRLDGAMLKTVVALAWPTMLEQLMQTAVQYIDTAMVGVAGHTGHGGGGRHRHGQLAGRQHGVVDRRGLLAFISQALGAGDGGARRASAQAWSVTPGRRAGFYGDHAGPERLHARLDAGRSGHPRPGGAVFPHPLPPRCSSGRPRSSWVRCCAPPGTRGRPCGSGIVVNLMNVVLNYC